MNQSLSACIGVGAGTQAAMAAWTAATWTADDEALVASCAAAMLAFISSCTTHASPSPPRVIRF
jgi:hypothetical protein